MGATIWNASGDITVTGHSQQLFAATQLQTLFILTLFSYVIGVDSISVYINGILQMPGTYTETSTTSITLSEGAQVGDAVLITSTVIPSP